VFAFWAAWIGLRDYVAGAIFKTNHDLRQNDSVRIGDFSGKIVKFAANKLVLETGSGEIIYLPYGNLFGKAIIKSHPAETILNYTFRFEVPKGSNILEITEKVYADIINLPWSSLKKGPQVKPLKETATGYILEATVFSMEKEYFSQIEKVIKERYGMAPLSDSTD
jgi:small-conductance mechanosensitive channel